MNSLLSLIQSFHNSQLCQYSLKVFFLFRYCSLLVGLFLYEAQRTSICKCGRLRASNLSNCDDLKRTTTLEFTTISPILYIQCYHTFLIIFLGSIINRNFFVYLPV